MKSANCDIHIGVLHGELSTAQGRYAPFSIPELREKGYDYWALGHIHTCQEVSSQPCAWYSGTTQGADRKESGPKGVLLVEITPGNAPEVHFIETSTMDWTEVELSISESARLETLPYLIVEALPSPAKRSLVTLLTNARIAVFKRRFKTTDRSREWIVRRKTKPCNSDEYSRTSYKTASWRFWNFSCGRGGCITLF